MVYTPTEADSAMQEIVIRHDRVRNRFLATKRSGDINQEDLNNLEQEIRSFADYSMAEVRKFSSFEYRRRIRGILTYWDKNFFDGTLVIDLGPFPW